MFVCTNCGESKTPNEFQSNERYASGFSTWCKACHKAASQKSRVKIRTLNPNKCREDKIQHLYKLTPAKYDAKLAEQGGHCALCETVPGKRRLHVDHSHECCPSKATCGKCVRGLLCSQCNIRLGALEVTLAEALVIPKAGTIKNLLDPPTWTALAIAYLESYKLRAAAITKYTAPNRPNGILRAAVDAVEKDLATLGKDLAEGKVPDLIVRRTSRFDQEY